MTKNLTHRTVAVLGAACLLVAAPLAAGAAVPAEPESTPEIAVRIQESMAGLDHPWDVAFTPDDTMLVTERDRERILAKLPNGTVRVLADNPPGVWHGGETGLMGIVVDPDFETNRNIYTCNGSDDGRRLDIRVFKWEINAGFTAATQVQTVVKGMPVSSGRHGGCRLRFAPNGALYIGTGDAAQGTNPQDLTSLGGKVLRVNPANGRGFRGNPFIEFSDPNTKKIWTYGHRNVQGLAWRRGEGITPAMWSVEQGTDRDDEVNQLVEAGNAGYNPVPGYNESVPMTDHSLDNVFDAKWSSGSPTLATSGATWITAEKWGNWKGRLAVAALKDTSLQLMRFGPFGGLIDVVEIEDLDDNFGRLRTAQTGPAGNLYITTDNGGGGDYVLKVSPR